jgi:hypothetical protein
MMECSITQSKRFSKIQEFIDISLQKLHDEETGGVKYSKVNTSK